jgi:hypothetical protein
VAGLTYVIRTDLPPEGVTQIALEIYARWVDFAMGGSAIGGRRLISPTGRYASSIQYKQEAEHVVAIVADENIAPEAAYIEHGHGAVDLKTRLQSGKAYRMNRSTGAAPSMSPKMWGEMRRAGNTGFASFGPNSAPDSWVIPAMQAYSPALILAAQMTAMMRGRRP